MPFDQRTHSSGIIANNISYYNEVAGSYNDFMEEQASNKEVRDFVKSKFLREVEAGWVLDFGGGTGLDLPWLTDRYNVIFCEPSDCMRDEAISLINEQLTGKNVRLLKSGQTDFASWVKQPPLLTPADAILANFGVLNYISELKSLFNNFASVLKPGGHCILLILELDLRKRLKWHRRNAIKSLFYRSPFKMYIPYKNQRQLVFVHTPGEVRRACAQYFSFCSAESLKGFDFTLIHLVRK